MANPAVIAGVAVAGAGAVTYVALRKPMAYQFGNPSYVPAPRDVGYMESPATNFQRPSVNNPSANQIQTEALKLAKSQWDSMTSGARQGVISDLANKYPGAAAALKSINVSDLKSFSSVSKTLTSAAGAGVAATACAGTGIGAAAAPLCGAIGAKVGAIAGKTAIQATKTTVKVIKAPLKPAKQIGKVVAKKVVAKSAKKVGKAAKKAVKKLKFW